MKAFVITPGTPGGRVAEVPEPRPTSEQALVEVIEVGGCGTDRELLSGLYGEAPPGADHLVIGHESLGRVVSSPNDTLVAGDLVVAIVRRPDPEPCVNCASGEWDMCLNGRYTEHGIKAAHGYMAERYVEEPRYLVRVPAEAAAFAVLLEPLSIVEKGLDHIRRIQTRLVWAPNCALVLGAGTIGTLAALLLRLEGFDVYVYSRGDGGPGRKIAERAGAQFLSADNVKLGHPLKRDIGLIDVVIEATGASALAFEAMDVVGVNGVVCLTGVSAGSRRIRINSDHLNLEMVLENKLVFGTVNANRRHFNAGVQHLQAIEARWPGLLSQIITRRISMDEFSADQLGQPGDLKVAVRVGS